ncbi:MAG: hypothetical protein M0C28_22590 [Candidatus Moduliflexus flocculans]|nr:hypothetical protein [Candidatus Moduliflexus flocculans]
MVLVLLVGSDTNALNELIGTCQALLAQLDYQTIQKEIEKHQNHLSDLAYLKNTHFIVGEVLQAFIERNIDLYHRQIDQIKTPTK